jgi:beta-galactosidase
LWSPETPYLYKAVSQLYVGKELKDAISTSFGIREIKYEPNKGFSLNGKVTKFKAFVFTTILVP